MKKNFFIAFTAMVLAACLLPLGANLLGYTAENRENRPLARAPKLINRDGLNLELPADFDDYWQDHFGLREEYVTAFHAATLAVFNDTLNEKVIAGKQDFLFYSETLNDHLGLERMSDADICRAANVLRLIGEYAQSCGAEFVFAVAPNKNTIYPEYMPDRLKRTSRSTNAQRLYAALAENGVETLDFEALLNEHKSEGLLYYQHDTHWNQRGALIAYNAIMQRLMQGEEYASYSDAAAQDAAGYYGDLHNFVLPAEYSKLVYPEYDIQSDYLIDEGARAEQDMSFGTSSAANSKALLLYRDSFGKALIPLLSSNVGRAVYSQEFPYNLEFTAESFDLIMIELVERNIPNLLTAAPLMCAIEKQLPADASPVTFTAQSKQASGFVQLSGSISKYTSSERIFVEVLLDSGITSVYEAFPVNDSAAAPGSGYSLTLPAQQNGSVIGVYIS